MTDRWRVVSILLVAVQVALGVMMMVRFEQTKHLWDKLPTAMVHHIKIISVDGADREAIMALDAPTGVDAYVTCAKDLCVVAMTVKNPTKERNRKNVVFYKSH